MNISLWVVAGLVSRDGCLPIEGPNIRAIDLASRLPAFAQIAADTTFALAPNYGVRRDISGQTLARWARGGSFDPICLYRVSATTHLNWPQEIAAELRRAFTLDVASESVKLEEAQIAPGPGGALSLPKHGLTYDDRSKCYLWRGKLGAATLRLRFAWNYRVSRLAAARALLIGQKLTAADFSTVELPWVPSSERPLATVDAAFGQVLRRSLPKNTIFLESHLAAAPAIEAGDAVDLVSRYGKAAIHVPAIARTNARVGDPLTVSTLEDHRILRVVATGPGTAEIAKPNSRKTE